MSFCVEHLVWGVERGKEHEEPHNAVRAEPTSHFWRTTLWNLSVPYVKLCVLCVLLFCVSVNPSFAQDFQWDGYVKYLPTMQTDNRYANSQFTQLIHQRVNLEWRISDKLSWNGSLRTRYFYGAQAENNIPGIGPRPDLFAQGLENDDGVFSLTKNLHEGDKSVLTTTSDRFYFTYEFENVTIRAGRQRVNWAISTAFNPNDLFNVYNFFDFDYQERPGADAIQLQFYPTPMSRAELVISSGKTYQDLVAGGLYSFNYNEYDIQFISGLFHNRLAIGTGWAGSLGEMGFKGEATWFKNLTIFGEHTAGSRPSNLVANVGLDFLFDNGIYWLGEYLFNQSRFDDTNSLLAFTQPLRADRLSFTDHVIFTQASYPINPIINAGLGAMIFPSENGFFISPNLSWNAQQNLDVQILAQYFFGKQNSLLENAGFLTAFVAKWNF